MNLKKIVKSVLPFAKTLGAALAGPAGPIVNMALTAVGDALGVEPTKTTIERALITDPDAASKLYQANIDFDKRMAELDVDVFSLEIKDRDSARAMAKVNMWPQIVLSVLFISGYFGVVFQLLSAT